MITKKPKMLLTLIVILLILAVTVGCTSAGAKDEEAKIVPLTSEEVEQYNQALEPFITDEQGDSRINPLSHFLRPYYDRPENLNLAEFLRYYPSDEDVTNEAEFEVLKAVENWPFGSDMSLENMPVPIHKFSADTVNEVLKKYMGITLDDLSGVGMNELIYLKEYDAYYNFTSDFAAGIFACVRGETQGDIIRLYGETVVLTLKKQGDGFLFVSHQRVGDETDSAEIPEGIIPDDIFVPDAVLASAKDHVVQQYQYWSGSTGHYAGSGNETQMIGEPASFDNWRIEGLSLVYSYEEIDGQPVSAYQQSADEHWQSVDVYRLNYRIHTTTPEKAQLLLAGGMDLDGEGWLLPTYPNSTYLIFALDDNDERFLFKMMENDCSPGDELFTNDLKTLLVQGDSDSANNNRELSEMVYVYKNAVEAYAWFALSALETSNDSREHNGVFYNKVTDDRFKSWPISKTICIRYFRTAS